MNSEYVPLIQKEELWAQMLIQVLEDHHIPCAACFRGGFRTQKRDAGVSAGIYSL